MKKLLGAHRKLIGDAKWATKTIFLKGLTEEHSSAIRRVFGFGPGQFWRAANGKMFLSLPPEFVQGELDFGDEMVLG